MAAVTDKAIVLAVEQFFQRPEIHGNLDYLSHCLPGSADIVVAGGAIRNVIIDVLHGHAPPTRDVDLFIGGLDPNFCLAKALEGQAVEPTALKGVRWYPVSAGLAFDLCRFPDFVVIDTYNLEPTMDNLLSGIDFTVNAILYDCRRKTLVEKGCTVAVRDRVIDFNSNLIPDKALIAYRILLIGHKTGFNLSERVFQFIKMRLELATLTHIKNLLRAKVGKLMATAIMGDYDDLCKYPSYDAYLAGRAGRP